MEIAHRWHKQYGKEPLSSLEQQKTLFLNESIVIAMITGQFKHLLKAYLLSRASEVGDFKGQHQQQATRWWPNPSYDLQGGACGGGNSGAVCTCIAALHLSADAEVQGPGPGCLWHRLFLVSR